MKSWGFSRMREQWIPDHFSLLPRDLGTRLLHGISYSVSACKMLYWLQSYCSTKCMLGLASFPGHSQILSCSCRDKPAEGRLLQLLRLYRCSVQVLQEMLRIQEGVTEQLCNTVVSKKCRGQLSDYDLGFFLTTSE